MTQTFHLWADHRPRYEKIVLVSRCYSLHGAHIFQIHKTELTSQEPVSKTNSIYALAVNPKSVPSGSVGKGCGMQSFAALFQKRSEAGSNSILLRYLLLRDSAMSARGVATRYSKMMFRSSIGIKTRSVWLPHTRSSAVSLSLVGSPTPGPIVGPDWGRDNFALITFRRFDRFPPHSIGIDVADIWRDGYEEVEERDKGWWTSPRIKHPFAIVWGLVSSADKCI